MSERALELWKISIFYVLCFRAVLCGKPFAFALVSWSTMLHCVIIFFPLLPRYSLILALISLVPLFAFVFALNGVLMLFAVVAQKMHFE